MVWCGTPRLRASYTQNARSESCTCRWSMISSVLSFSKSGSVSVSMPSSMEETAFISACSKLLPMAMTSPVAIIWVPSDLSA